MSQGGFTLLEVLLALVLSVAILAALWSALSLHVRSFDSGRETTQRAQLARAVLRRIAQDLRRVATPGAPQAAARAPFDTAAADGQTAAADAAALPTGGALALLGFAPPAPAATPPVAVATTFTEAVAGANADSSGPRRGLLVGQPDRIRLRVAAGIEASGAIRGTVEPNAREDQAVESRLRVVQYSLAVDDGAADAAPGLIRREFDWRPQVAETQARTSRGTALNLALAAGDDPFEAVAAADERSPEALPVDLEEPAPVLAEEVESLEFRYFDGGQWVGDWDSDARGRLPRAVEIVLSLRAPERPAPRAASAARRAPAQPAEPAAPSRWRLVVALVQGGSTVEPTRLDEPVPTRGAAPGGGPAAIRGGAPHQSPPNSFPQAAP